MPHPVNAKRASFATAAFLSILATLLLAGCLWHPGRGLKSCRYRFQSFTFTGIDGHQTHWDVEIAIANPNSREVTLSRMHFALLHEADTLLSGWNPEQRAIAAGDSTVIHATLDLPNTVWKRLPPGIWSQTDAQFRVVADAYLETWAGNILVPNAVGETLHVDMPAQVAKYRDIMLKKFFSGWPGSHLRDEAPAPGAASPVDTTQDAPP